MKPAFLEGPFGHLGGLRSGAVKVEVEHLTYTAWPSATLDDFTAPPLSSLTMG